MTSCKLEQDVGRYTVALFRSWGFDVYQEVTSGLGRCDLVATRQQGRASLLYACELKMRFTWEVIYQALRWIPHAHRSFIAVYSPNGVPHLAEKFLEDLGLGLIEVSDYRINLSVRARLNKRPDDRLRRSLYEEQRTYANAGTTGTHWTPFKNTARAVQQYVREHPGCTTKAIVDGADHHYPNDRAARQGISHWIGNGVIPGIRIERTADGFRYYPDEEGNKT